jgi:hypothetical protein
VTEAIERRWQFTLPEDYVRLYGRGVFEERERFVVNGPLRFTFTDLSWLTLDQIAAFEPFEYQVPGLVPFARSGRRDLWCWYPTLRHAAGAPVVFCPVDCDTAEVYAPDFTHFLYRRVLEEFGGTWLDDQFGREELRALWTRYVDALSAVVDPSRLGPLRAFLDRPFTTNDGAVALASWDEIDEVIARYLAFPLLRHEFKHYV